jgi:hypothetical protein
MRSAQNIDQRITENNFQIYTSVLEIILGDLLRGRAKSSGCLGLASFPEFSRQRALPSLARSPLGRLGRLLRLLEKQTSLIEHCSIGWSVTGLPVWRRSRVSHGSIAVVKETFQP